MSADGGIPGITEEELLAALPMELVSGGLGGIALDEEFDDFEEEEDENLDEEEASVEGDEEDEDGEVELPDGPEGSHVYEVTEVATPQHVAAAGAAEARYAPQLNVPIAFEAAEFSC